MDRTYTLQVRGLVTGDIRDVGDLEAALMEAVYAVLEERSIEGAPSAYVELLNPLELVPNSLDSDSFENYE